MTDQHEPDLDDRARKQVRAFFHEIEANYGVEAKDLHNLFEDLRWIAKHRKAFDRVQNGVTMSLVLAVASGMLLALWEGLKHLIHRGGS